MSSVIQQSIMPALNADWGGSADHHGRKPSASAHFQRVTKALDDGILAARWAALNELLNGESFSVQLLLPLNPPPQPPPRRIPPQRQVQRPLAAVQCSWRELACEFISAGAWMLALFSSCAALWAWV